MAFPVIATSAQDGEAATPTSHVITLPSGIASGDLLIVPFVSFVAAPTWPAGWTQLFTNTRTQVPFTFEARYRVSDGSEGATMTITTSPGGNSCAFPMRITGHDSAIAPEATTTNNRQVTWDPPALTPTGGAKDYLWIGLVATNGTTPDTTAYAPANYTELASFAFGTFYIQAASRDLNAASEDPGIGTIGGNHHSVYATIAVHPIVAAAGGPPVNSLLLTGVGR